MVHEFVDLAASAGHRIDLAARLVDELGCAAEQDAQAAQAATLLELEGHVHVPQPAVAGYLPPRAAPFDLD